MRTVAFASYLTTTHIQWRTEDYNASKFIKAIKGDELRGFAMVPVCGGYKKLDQTNAHEAVGWFGDMAAAYLHNAGLDNITIALVPIPGSLCCKLRESSRTVGLAKAIAERVRCATVWDGLRWREARRSSRHGGTRDPAQLVANLRVRRSLPNCPLVLIDDVVTTGAHLKASRLLLINNGANCDLAVCAGRTVLEPMDDPFSISTSTLDDLPARQRT